MARKRGDDGGGGESWLNTYADMVTLLLTFFVVLFSMSSVDDAEWQKLADALSIYKGESAEQLVLTQEGTEEEYGKNLGASDGISDTTTQTGDLMSNDLPVDFADLYEYLRQYIEQNNMEASVSIERQGENRIFIKFQNSIFFGPDKAELLPDAKPILDFFSDCLISVNDQLMVVNVGGHTADVPTSNVSDRVLSSARAANVAYYMEEHGVDGAKVLSIGYGNHVPIADNNTSDGRRQNRRVEMLIIGTEDEQEISLFEQILKGNYDENIYPQVGSAEDALIPEGLLEGATAAAETTAAATPTPEAAPQPTEEGAAAGEGTPPTPAPETPQTTSP